RAARLALGVDGHAAGPKSRASAGGAGTGQGTRHSTHAPCTFARLGFAGSTPTPVLPRGRPATGDPRNVRKRPLACPSARPHVSTAARRVARRGDHAVPRRAAERHRLCAYL